jgi:hypothetical protein
VAATGSSWVASGRWSTRVLGHLPAASARNRDHFGDLLPALRAAHPLPHGLECWGSVRTAQAYAQVRSNRAAPTRDANAEVAGPSNARPSVIQIFAANLGRSGSSLAALGYDKGYLAQRGAALFV